MDNDRRLDDLTAKSLAGAREAAARYVRRTCPDPDLILAMLDLKETA